MNRIRVKNELKIGIETVTKCGGNCDGCILTKEERQSSDNFFMSRDKLEILSEKVSEYIKDYENNFGCIDELAVNFGQGDHFLLNEEDISFYVSWMHRTFLGKGNCFITASAISSRDNVIKKADLFHEKAIESKQMLLMDIVYSPLKASIKNFSESYSDNLTYIRNKFGGADFVVNMGIDILDNVTPLELSEFVLKNKLSISTIVLPPNVYFGEDKGSYIDWLVDYYNIWIENLNSKNFQYEINYGPVLGRSIEYYMNSNSEQQDGFSLLFKELYIDFDLNVYFAQTGIGDFGLSKRFGFEPIFNLQDSGKMFDNIKKSIARHKINILKGFVSKKCLECEFIEVCKHSMLGYSKGNKMIGNECFLSVFPLLNTIKENVLLNKDIKSTCYQDKKPLIQSGLKKVEVDNAISIDTVSSGNKEKIIF